MLQEQEFFEVSESKGREDIDRLNLIGLACRPALLRDGLTWLVV